jgi:hypothetical protein
MKEKMKSELIAWGLLIAVCIMAVYIVMSVILGNIYGTYPRYPDTITVKSYIGDTGNGVLSTDGRGFKQNFFIFIRLEEGKTYDIQYYIDPIYHERWIMEYSEVTVSIQQKCSIYTEGDCMK